MEFDHDGMVGGGGGRNLHSLGKVRSANKPRIFALSGISAREPNPEDTSMPIFPHLTSREGSYV